ncbi:MAG: PmoA family protein [Planctomycetota bacterium]
MRLPFVVAVTLLCACASPRVDTQRDGDAVHVWIDGQPFGTVHCGASPRPFVFPVIGPGGVAMTRSFPMADVAGETKDHPHHVSLWFAHGDVNGFDFWAGKRGERIEWDGRCEVASGEAGRVVCGYRWLAGDTLVCTEERELRFAAFGDDARTIDVIVTLRPAVTALVLGDTKEGTFAVRVREELRVDGSGGKARLIDSEGRRDGAAWGKRARWIDDTGIVDGREVGMALFDHPGNHAHPTWWHARTYGLLAANPFGVHDFERKPAGTGSLTVPVGGSLRLHYRVLLHGAGWDRARLDAAFAAWLGTEPSR